MSPWNSRETAERSEAVARTTVSSKAAGRGEDTNYAAIAAISGVLFFERFAYYAFRTSMFVRLRGDVGLDGADIGRLSTLMTVVLLVGFVIGGAVSMFARNRLVLAGVVVALAAAHGLGAASVTVGALAISFFAGILRPLAMLALAEELGREGRMWFGMMAGACVALSSNLAGVGGGLVGSLTIRHGSFVAAPPALMMLSVVCAAVVAFVLPGAPFEWARASDARVVPGQGLYRAEPVVIRSSGGPSLFVLALVAVATVMSGCEQSVHSELLYRSAIGGVLPSLSPFISCIAAAVFGALAFALATSRSRVSATLALGGSLVGLSLAAFTLVGAVVMRLGPLKIPSVLFDGASDSVLLAVCYGFALATPSSRHAGLVGAALSAMFVLPAMMARVVTADAETGPVFLGVTGVLTLGVGVVILVAGPRVDVSPEPDPAPRL